ncbi:hypothetical protein DV515_00019007, partial [Chloebia gouldiae]
MDLAAAVEVTIITTSPIKIQMGVKGPLMINGQTVGGLLLGRSSASMMGLFVLPGIIDADYTGEIMIMAHSFPRNKNSTGTKNCSACAPSATVKGDCSSPRCEK